MEKPQYNQGDLLQFQRSRHGPTHLLVITKVYTIGYPDSNTYYKAVWVAKGEKEVYGISDLDDSRHVTLVARGQ